MRRIFPSIPASSILPVEHSAHACFFETCGQSRTADIVTLIGAGRHGLTRRLTRSRQRSVASAVFYWRQCKPSFCAKENFRFRLVRAVFSLSPAAVCFAKVVYKKRPLYYQLSRKCIVFSCQRIKKVWSVRFSDDRHFVTGSAGRISAISRCPVSEKDLEQRTAKIFDCVDSTYPGQTELWTIAVTGKGDAVNIKFCVCMCVFVSAGICVLSAELHGAECDAASWVVNSVQNFRSQRWRGFSKASTCPRHKKMASN